MPLVQAIAELSEADLHRSLARLQAAEFLYETRLFPERDFTFKHALTHEVAYSGLLQERRRGLHARIVEELETLYAERLAEQVERLAHHARRGEVWDKAVVYCRQAAAKAAARPAYREAVGYFEQALEVLKHLPESRSILEQAVDLRLDLRHSLARQRAFGRALDYLGEAKTLAEALGDQHRLAQVSSYMADYFRVMGDYDRALAAGQRALALVVALGDVPLQALAEAHTLVEQHEIRCWEAEIHRLRGVLLLQQPGTPPAEAEACFQQALDVARCQEAKSLELGAAMSLSRLWQQQGKREEARDVLAPVSGWFTEGLDTADLQETRVLLEQLGVSRDHATAYSRLSRACILRYQASLRPYDTIGR